MQELNQIYYLLGAKHRQNARTMILFRVIDLLCFKLPPSRKANQKKFF